MVFFVSLSAAGVFAGEKGVTKDSIKVGASLDMTGPTAFVRKALADGIKVYFFPPLTQKGESMAERLSFMRLKITVTSLRERQHQ